MVEGACAFVMRAKQKAVEPFPVEGRKPNTADAQVAVQRTALRERQRISRRKHAPCTVCVR